MLKITINSPNVETTIISVEVDNSLVPMTDTLHDIMKKFAVLLGEASEQMIKH